MEDADIIALYWNREERAIAETAAKYGGFCQRIAQNILTIREDAEECVNDTYQQAWTAMPPLAGTGGAQSGHQPVAEKPCPETVCRAGEPVQ